MLLRLSTLGRPSPCGARSRDKDGSRGANTDLRASPAALRASTARARLWLYVFTTVSGSSARQRHESVSEHGPLCGPAFGRLVRSLAAAVHGDGLRGGARERVPWPASETSCGEATLAARPPWPRGSASPLCALLGCVRTPTRVTTRAARQSTRNHYLHLVC